MKSFEFLKDHQGKLSMTRLIYFSWSFIVLLVWAFNSLTTKQIAVLDNSVVIILSAFITGKVAQSFSEKQKDQE